MQAATEQTSTTQSPSHTGSSSDMSTDTSGILFVAGCVVLPVIWGILVHLVFTWLRKKYQADQNGAPSWPDYQI